MAMSRRREELIELDLDPPFRVAEPDEEQPLSDNDDERELAQTLCDRCRRFDIQTFAACEDHRRGYKLSDVEAATSCDFCMLLRDSVKDVAPPKDVLEEGPGFLTRREDRPELYVHMTLSTDYSSAKQSARPSERGMRANRLRAEIADRFSEVRNASDHELCLVADPRSAAFCSGDVTGQYLGNDPDSEGHFEAIRTWIEECSMHPKCNQTVSGLEDINARRSPLPSRVIEISKSGLGIRFRLREAQGMHGAYITLSHRWNAETEACKTTSANYQSRLQGKDLKGLPQLFKDVFQIAAKLGVSYVWIDSLCIIQHGDDNVDWSIEASKMAQYYQFSLLTVAGTMLHPQNGLLSPYPEDMLPWESKLVRMPYRSRYGTRSGYFYVYKRAVPLLNEFRDLVRESHLSRRGWVLQEWLLSKRILWYTSRGLFFECHTQGPRTERQERILPEAIQAEQRWHLRLKASFHFDSESILDFWYRTLEVYSACGLTNPEQDRLLAIVGLAKEVSLILSRKPRDSSVNGISHELYLSGLWLCDIHHGLLWEENHNSSAGVTKVDRAPSWSWSSMVGPVRWPPSDEGSITALKLEGICFSQRHQYHTPEFRIEKGYAVRPSSGASPGGHHGRLMQRADFDATSMSACLHLRGALQPVHVRGYLETEENLDIAAFATAYGHTTQPRRWRAICSPRDPEVIGGWGSLEQLPSVEGRCDDAGVAVFALHVSTRYLRTGLWLKHADPVWDVLFLEKVNDTHPVFRRLGVGRIFERDLMREFETVAEQQFQLA